MAMVNLTTISYKKIELQWHLTKPRTFNL